MTHRSELIYFLQKSSIRPSVKNQRERTRELCTASTLKNRELRDCLLYSPHLCVFFNRRCAVNCTIFKFNNASTKIRSYLNMSIRSYLNISILFLEKRPLNEPFNVARSLELPISVRNERYDCGKNMNVEIWEYIDSGRVGWKKGWKKGKAPQKPQQTGLHYPHKYTALASLWGSLHRSRGRVWTVN